MRSLLAVLAGVLVAGGAGLQAEDIRFNRDIRPIFSDNCFVCHGPDKNTRQAELRLDQREVALERGAIAPGDTAGSKLVARIHNENEMLRMPPAYSDKKLTEAQKELLTQWIEQGAEYESHWAYIPPVRPEAPEGPAAIDHLVGEKLEEQGLVPAGEASRRTLARRVSFDVTGLPPEPELVESFIKDQSPDAYKNLVDQLLASPHYGERMAVHWLDLVHYADTVGFHGDVAVNVFPYRDYVIRAFNGNKPFDEFTREQLGGDLMPDATLDQKVASAYNRLSRMTNEGGSQAKEYLAKYAADRARTVSTVWMASTMGCAECHDHKFDPFEAKDFYSMQAFFADIEEEGVFVGYGDWGSSIQVPTPEARERIKGIESEIKRLRNAGQGKLPPSVENLREYVSYLKEELDRWRVLDQIEVWNDCSDPDINECDKFKIEARDGGFVHPVFGEDKPGKLAQVVEAELEAGRITALLIEVFPTDECEEFFIGEVEVRWRRDGEPPLRVTIKDFLPDWEGNGSWLRGVIDGNHHTGWGGNPNDEGTRRAILTFEQPLEVEAGDKLSVTTIYERMFGLSGLAYSQRLSVTGSDAPELPISDYAAKVLAEAEWNEDQRGAIERVFRKRTASNPNWREIRSLERRKKNLIDQAGQTLITKAVEPRPIRVLPRGNWMDDSGEVVEPQAPHFLGQIPTNGRRLNRLDLGNWLVDRENPLTARVFVNRLWKMYFGTGISKVLDDLGSQGEPPVNQKLLDWLAVEFMESGWDVKHIIRTMLLSETYRRSSEPSEELLAADPYNRLHGRQNATRLDAEFIRDNALAVSGLLNNKVGGRSAKPYQPKGYYKELNFPKREYHADLDDNQFRRGLYTHWQRTYLHPAMRAFDAPSREECAADRPVSNTPLQSLVLLNDPTFVEAAKALAGRILTEGGEDPSSRIDYAYRRAFSREAADEEKEVLLSLLDSQRKHFQMDITRALDLLDTGISEAPPDLDSAELAAWTSVSRTLMNKHEFVVKY